jgi:hypothetical protein
MFEEVKNQPGNCAIEEPTTPVMEIYDEDGDLKPPFATEAFCEMKRDELLKLDSAVLADVILDSREVFTKATEVEYVAITLLAACLEGLLRGEPNYTKMFQHLTENGARNMSTEELTELLHGFVFAKSKELNVMMALSRMMN